MAIIKDSSDYFTQLADNRNPMMVKSLFEYVKEANNTCDWNLVIGQNDKGVELNRGRIGSRDAGRVLLHHLSTMIKPIHGSFSINPYFMPPDLAQIPLKLWRKNLLHLGSGHDHVFHFLQLALKKGIKNFFIINLDAHADMRKDNLLHSGTPFRFFFEQYKNEIKKYTLHQYGLSAYSQNPSDLELTGAHVQVLWQQQMNTSNIQAALMDLKNEIAKIENRDETLVLVSLDADVITGSSMSAVSAVNPRGISTEVIFQTLKYIKEEFQAFCPQLGIYEYNPLYDEISGKGAKLLATIIYDWIFPCHSNNS